MSATDRARTAESVLAERIGLDPQTVGAGVILRALHARMSALWLRDREAYLQRLSASSDEQQELIEEVVIPESWFFRDDRPFDALREIATARSPGPTDPLRVLSIPCGCGEEPYSIAIALRDLGLAPSRFRIDAVDVSARHLAVAERGVYRANSFRGTALGFRDRHFRPDERRQCFTLDPAIRVLVRFLRGNLLDPQLQAGEPPYDVIFCRNLLIYLDAGARRRALGTLDRLLAASGVLFVGHAERLAIDDPRFEPYGEAARFALHRTSGPPRTSRAPAVSPPPRTVPKPAPAPPSAPRSATEPKSAAKAPAPAATVAEPTAARSLPESSRVLLAEAAALADQGRNDEAASRCEQALGRFGPSAAAYFLLGLLRQARDRIAEAEACFRKAIYLDPDHDEALLALALIAQRRGDRERAAGYRRRAERARSKKGAP